MLLSAFFTLRAKWWFAPLGVLLCSLILLLEFTFSLVFVLR